MGNLSLGSNSKIVLVDARPYGAPVHRTTEAKKFLAEKLRDRVINRGTDSAWPVHSPDLIVGALSQK